MKERSSCQLLMFFVHEADGIARADAKHFTQLGFTNGRLIENGEGDLVIVLELVEVASRVFVEARFSIRGRADENFAEALQAGTIERRRDPCQLSTDRRIADFAQDEPQTTLAIAQVVLQQKLGLAAFAIVFGIRARTPG